MPAPAKDQTTRGKPTYELGRASEIGYRRKNQDRCGAVETDLGVLLILADGMGGHPKGERASQLVVDTCSNIFRKTREPLPDPTALLERMVMKAHREVVAYGQKRRPPIEPRSTAIVALVRHGVLHWAHVGDSRLYLLRNGQLEAKTVDHSYVQQLRDQGLAEGRDLQTHPFRNYVTRCVGGTVASPDPAFGGPLQLKHGDLILLCTDGLWSQIDATQIAALLTTKVDMKDSLAQLVKLAVHTGAPTSDNVTVIALRWTGSTTPQKATQAKEDELSRAIADIKQALSQFHEDDQP